MRGLAGLSSGLWCALRCLGLGRRARLRGAGVRQGDDGALSLLRAASDVKGWDDLADGQIANEIMWQKI